MLLKLSAPSEKECFLYNHIIKFLEHIPTLITFRAICKSRNGDRGTEWWNDGNAGNHGENAGNQGGNAEKGGGNEGNQGGECGELGWFFVRIFLFIASAKILESEGSISPSSFYGQPPHY